MVLSGVIMTLNEGVSGIVPATLVILACFCWGIDNHTTGLIQILSPSQVTVVKGIFAGSINLIIGIILNFQSTNTENTLGTQSMNVIVWNIIGALLVGIVSYGISIVLYIVSAQQIGSTRAQVLFSSSPILGLLLSVLLLNEDMTYYHVLAIISTIIGIYFSNKTSHDHRHHHKYLLHSHEHIHADEHHDHGHKRGKALDSTSHINQGLKTKQLPQKKGGLSKKKSQAHTHLHVHEEKDHLMVVCREQYYSSLFFQKLFRLY